MAATSGVIEFDFARVHWCTRPTAMDAVGCDGIYVELVEIKPLREWKFRSMLTVGARVGLQLLRVPRDG